jgi:hypothetical protein
LANPWLRLYSEFASDPKVQMMSEALQRRLMMLFCLRCNESLLSVTECELAFALRISQTELSETKIVFMAKGFIDENWQLLNWTKRQPLSDHTVAARVRKHREKMKNERGLFDPPEDVKRYSNSPEQNRTEQNRKSSARARGNRQAKPSPTVGVAKPDTFEEREAAEANLRREQLATWRYARDHNTVLWKSVDLAIVRALDAEDAAIRNASVNSCTNSAVSV